MDPMTTTPDVDDISALRALRALHAFRDRVVPNLSPWRKNTPQWNSLPTISTNRIAKSWSTQTIRSTSAKSPRISPRLNIDNKDEDDSSQTYLYLAYGSNLSAETFLGRRGIRPLSATNVAVPSLRLTFDLPGIPYIEPCFANSGRRDPESDSSTLRATMSQSNLVSSEKSPLLAPTTADYHKDHWHKPLVGVVYEVTSEDYYHIIATEGGGASYQDIQVPCYPLLPSDATVPAHPSTTPFLAHTLYAPAIGSAPPPPGSPPPSRGGRFERPDPAYAQPSARYLHLITSGASEHGLPREYQDYLAQIRPYTISTQAQRLGLFVFLSIWSPVFVFIIGTGSFFADENGKVPGWWAQLTKAFIVGCWGSYDGFFAAVFGDGERTVGDGGRKGDDGAAERCVRNERRMGRLAAWAELGAGEEKTVEDMV